MIDRLLLAVLSRSPMAEAVVRLIPIPLSTCKQRLGLRPE
jgi:hypothetical protein